MMGIGRPRGRDTTVRAIGAAAMAAAVLGGGAAAATGEQAAAVAPAIESFAGDAPVWTSLAAGPDGAVWSFEPNSQDGLAISRYGRAGRLSRATVSAPVGRGVTPLVPQSDGGMALVARDYRTEYVARLRTDARGARVTVARLPRSSKDADAFAVAPDGAVWWVDSCADSLYRWRPGQRLAHVRLQPAICEAGASSALTVGPDGAVWLVNGQQGRIVRHDVRGRTRQWNFTPGGETSGATILVADPRGGGAAFADASPSTTAAGIVTPSGRFLPSRIGMPAYGPGGKVWQLAQGRIAMSTERDVVASHQLPPGTDPVTVAVDRDGAPWFTSGRYSSPPSVDATFDDVAVGTVRIGAAVTWPLVGEGGGASQLADAPSPLVLGGDGALWTRVQDGRTEQKIVRVVPPGLRAPRRPVARVTGLLGRDGRTVVLQVRCAAERGRFCRGTVGLGGSAKAVRYVAPGQSGAAVSLTLTVRAARTIDRSGSLKAGALVRSAGGGSTRATVRLRR